MSDYVQHNCNASIFNNSNSWVIMSSIEKSIKEKIEQHGIPLKNWDIKIYRGILTGFNDAFIISSEKRKEILDNCNSQDERLRTDELIRPILRGKDIRKYEYSFANLYLINAHNGIKEKNIPRININDYPAVKKHLNNYWDKISTRADKGDTPYNLRNCAYMDEFNKPKIIFQEIVQESQFMLDYDKGFFCNDTCRIITGKSLTFLAGILNSKLFFFAVKTFYGGGGLGDSGVRMKHTFFENFSCISEDVMINKLVLNISSHNVIEQSRLIDQRIYELYNLTDEEINYIENN